MKKFLSLLLAAVLTVCSLSFVSAESRVDMPVREGVGMSIAGFETVDLGGNPVTDEILQNADVTIINHWSPACGYCVMDLPFVQAMHEFYSATPEADVQIIGVPSDFGGATYEDAKAALAENGCTYINLERCDTLNKVFNTGGGYPQFLVVDRNGIVRDHVVGAFPDENDMHEFIDMWYDAIGVHAGETCTITYVSSLTDEIIGTAEVEYGAILPEPPEAPEAEGHSFLRWEYDDNAYPAGAYNDPVMVAMGDITATAFYKAAKHKVKFYDGVTGDIIKMQTVEHGKSAKAPEHPEHEGYVFTGWDTDFSCVTEDLEVHGICVPDTEYLAPGDVDGSGTVDMTDAIFVMRYTLGVLDFTPQQLEAADFNNDGVIDTADAIFIMRASLGL